MKLEAKDINNIILAKMLFSQVPYFGSSVQYAMLENDTREFWIYHLSTLTRDPARMLDSKTALKSMRDYVTAGGSELPLNDHRNLGTGVAEAKWKKLRVEMWHATIKRLKYNLNSENREKIGGEKFDQYERVYNELVKIYLSGPTEGTGTGR